MRRLAGFVAWLGLIGVAVLLLRLGDGALAPPPLTDDLAVLDAWADARDTPTVAAAALRLVALVLTGYLAAVSALAAVARATRVPALVRCADLVTTPAVRRLLGTLGGLGLAASGALLAQDAPAVTGPPGVVLERLPDEGGTVLARLPDLAPGVAPGDAEAPTPPAGAEIAQGGEWVVRPGDHLWHVAEATLTRAWGRTPADAEIAPFWREVVEHNRDRLVDPRDPDLIHPGQRLRVPAPPYQR